MLKNNKEKIYHIHIASEHKWYEVDLNEIWRYRDLILLFTKRNFLLTFKQTILGPIWIFLNPFITSIMFTVVFGGIAGITTEGIPQILFYLCSNALWTFFAECVSKNASVFVTNAPIFGKVYFPRIVVPISNAFSSLIRFGVQMILVIVFLIYYILLGDVQPHWEVWGLIPIALFQIGVLGLGIGSVISSFTTKYRDLSIVVEFGISLWMYATPIVYPLSQTGNSFMRTLLLINPVTSPIEFFRYAVLGKGTLVLGYHLLSWVITIILAAFGFLIFNHVEKTFMDTV